MEKKEISNFDANERGKSQSQVKIEYTEENSKLDKDNEIKKKKIKQFQSCKALTNLIKDIDINSSEKKSKKNLKDLKEEKENKKNEEKEENKPFVRGHMKSISSKDVRKGTKKMSTKRLLEEIGENSILHIKRRKIEFDAAKHLLNKKKKGKNALLCALRINVKNEISKRKIAPTTKMDKEITKYAEIFTKYDDNPNRISDNPIHQIPEKESFSYLKYILDQPKRNANEIMFLKYYILNLPSFVSIIGNSQPHEFEEILQKLAFFIQPMHCEEGQIICVNGEIGNNFYTILDGNFAVLVPSQYEEALTMEEYYNHLKNLQSLREFDLLIKTIEDNRYLYYDEKIKLMSSFDYDKDNCGSGEFSTVEEYIDSVKPIKIDYESRQLNDSDNSDNPPEPVKRVNLNLWGYIQVCVLSRGKSFGDIALKTAKENYRTATIIALNEGYLGYLTKAAYFMCVKIAQDKARRENIDKLYSHFLFKGMTIERFESMYFNHFSVNTKKYGTTLFDVGMKQEEIYFLQNGEIEISVTCTPKYLRVIENYFRDKLLSKYPYDNTRISIKEKEYAYDKLMQENYPHNKEKIDQYFSHENIYKINIFKGKGGVIGLDEFCFNKKYFCSARVISKTCEYFSMFKETFNKMVDKEQNVKQNYFSYCIKSHQKMFERLNYITTNNLLLYITRMNYGNLNALKEIQQKNLNNYEPLNPEEYFNYNHISTEQTEEDNNNDLDNIQNNQYKTITTDDYCGFTTNKSSNNMKVTFFIKKNHHNKISLHIPTVNKKNINNSKENPKEKSPFYKRYQNIVTNTESTQNTLDTNENNKETKSRNYVNTEASLSTDNYLKVLQDKFSFIRRKNFNNRPIPAELQSNMTIKDNMIDLILKERQRNIILTKEQIKEEWKNKNKTIDEKEIKLKKTPTSKVIFPKLDFLAMDRFIEKRQSFLRNYATERNKGFNGRLIKRKLNNKK